MKTITSIGFLILFPITLSGQNLKEIKLSADIPANEQIPNEYQFVFPTFMQGTIAFPNSAPSRAKFNYNFLFDEIQYINAKGEKMTMANPEEMISAVINKRVFIYRNKGFYEVIETGKISLLLKRHCFLYMENKPVGYGMTSSTSAVNSASYITSEGSREYKLTESGVYTIKLDSSYWISDGRKIFNALTLKNYKKLFSKNETEIDSFFKANQINMKQEADLRRLVDYCNSLK